MKARTFLCLATLALSFSASAQTTESSLRALYGEPVEGAFLVKPGVTLRAVYGPNGQACALSIAGPISDGALMRVFETAVPASARGPKTLEMVECMSVCRRVTRFEHVEFISGVIGN